MASIIKANQLQDFGGNSIIGSDGAGNLTTQKTNYPAFGVYMSANQSAANNTYTKINFNTEDYDTDNAYDTSNNRFTCPSGKDGKYMFHVKVMVDQVDDTERTEVVFYKNGTIDLKSFELDMASANDSGIFANTTFSFNLVAGDYVEAYAKHTEGGTRDIESGYSYFFGYRIGS